MRIGSCLVLLLLCLQAGPVLAADCTVAPFSTVPGADVTTRWTVRSGHPCQLLLSVGTGIDVSDMRVVEAAAGGTATTPTLNTIRYVPRPGFTGHDRFVVERTAEAMARRVLRGTAHWTVEVDVVP